MPLQTSVRFLFIVVALVGMTTATGFSGFSFAQDGDPLPSKTPTPTAETNAQVTPVTSVVIDEPFIQSDLRILSGNVQRPNGIFWHNGNLYVSCNGDWTLYEIDAETGVTATYIWGVRNAHTLYAEDDENGFLNLWVPDFQTNELILIQNQGATQTVASELNGPWGIDDFDERFIITNLLGNNIVLIDREGEVTEVASGFRSPAGIVADDTAVYVANNGSARRAIEWIDAEIIDEGGPIDATETDKVQPLVSGLQSTTGITMGPDNLLYISYSLGTRGVIGRVDPQECRENGGCTNDEVEIVVYTDLAAPIAGLSISPDMTLFAHTIFSPDIYYVALDSQRQSTVMR